MTLCIAAPCLEGAEERIVIAADRRVENALMGGDVSLKIDFPMDSWVAMFAGSVHDAFELTEVYRSHLKGQRVTKDNARTVLLEPAYARKRYLCDNYTRAKVGLSYEEFLDGGNERLPSDVFRDMVYEIAQLSLACQLILAGFVEDRLSMMFTLNGTDGNIVLGHTESFAAIGSGATVAETMLFLRGQQQACTLSQTLYAVFEAWAVASRVSPAVGRQVDIFIVKPKADNSGINILELGPPELALLSQLFGRFGPKQMTGELVVQVGAEMTPEEVLSKRKQV